MIFAPISLVRGKYIYIYICRGLNVCYKYIQVAQGEEEEEGAQGEEEEEGEEGSLDYKAFIIWSACPGILHNIIVLRIYIDFE